MRSACGRSGSTPGRSPRSRSKRERCSTRSASSGVRIVASGGLDEHAIAALLASGAPIDAFGVGTKTVTSEDAPTLDAVYKLVALGGDGRMKLSAEKATLPGRKQVFRQRDGADALRAATSSRRRPSTWTASRCSRRSWSAASARRPGERTLEDARAHASAELNRLPPSLLRLDPAPAYNVEISAGLRDEAQRLRDELSG